MTLNNAAARPATLNPSAAHAEPALRLSLTLEALFYVGLALLALSLRLVQLGNHPLDNTQAEQALAALRAVNPQVAGETLVADSPLTYLFNTISFSFMAQGNVAARLPVAIGGALLALAPLLWRRYLNPLPPLIMSLLLTISPVALLSARTMSPVTWTMLLAVIVPWLVLRYVETRRPDWAILATAAAAAMILLADPAGLLALLALAFGLAFAWLTADPADPDLDLPATVRELARSWPWANGGLAAGVVIAVVGTGFFFLPSGLTSVGNVLWTGVTGFVQRQDGAPVAFPLLVALRYETGLVLFGLLAVYRAVRQGGFFERTLAGWFLGGVVWSLGYAGATAGHALWLTVPLCALVGLSITHWLTERADFMWRVPSWSVTAHAAITFILWMAVGMSVLMLGKRLLLDVPGQITDLGTLVDKLTAGFYSRSTANTDWIEFEEGIGTWAYVLGFIQQGLLMMSLFTVMIGVLFFLVGSLWGARTGARGLALGTLAFTLLFSFGLGGRAAYGIPGDPREYWYLDPVTDDVDELRATLREMSLRDTGEPRLMAITAWIPGDGDSGALAWALRDFLNVTFVDGVGPEVATAAVLMPVIFPQPRMGADYVGKDLIIRQAWSAASLFWKDAIMWFYRGDSQIKPVTGEAYMIWIRKDVYGVEQVTEE
ncbi:MAG: hypothetical protein JXQ72_17805 [Anaerolineae bacterium]|nr:hypothetical protein [Anaerolineae bacterium]